MPSSVNTSWIFPLTPSPSLCFLIPKQQCFVCVVFEIYKNGRMSYVFFQSLLFFLQIEFLRFTYTAVFCSLHCCITFQSCHHTQCRYPFLRNWICARHLASDYFGQRNSQQSCMCILMLICKTSLGCETNENCWFMEQLLIQLPEIMTDVFQSGRISLHPDNLYKPFLLVSTLSQKLDSIDKHEPYRFAFSSSAIIKVERKR